MGKDDEEKQGAAVNTGTSSTPRRTEEDVNTGTSSTPRRTDADATPTQSAVAQDTQASTPVTPAVTPTTTAPAVAKDTPTSTPVTPADKPATTTPTAGNVVTDTINKAVSKVVTPVVDADVGAEIDKKYTVTDEMRDKVAKPYDDTVDAYKRVMEAYSPLESAEERERRERIERSRKKIYAITDGLSALSNLYFTSQYAPNMYNHEKSMSETERAALERAREEREKNRDAHLRAALGIAKAQADKEQGLRALETEMAKAKEAAKEAARKDRKFPLEMRVLGEKGDYYASLARKADEEADATPEKIAAWVAAKIAQANKDNSTARNNDRTPAGGKGGKGGSSGGKGSNGGEKGSSSGKGFNVTDGDGNTRFIKDEDVEREFTSLPKDVQKKAGSRGNLPNKEQKQQAISDYERTKGKKKKKISIH